MTMDQRTEKLRTELASYYSGEKSLEQNKDAIAKLSIRARHHYANFDQGSVERRWLEGLFRTLKEWGHDEWGASAEPSVTPESRRLPTFRDEMPTAVPYFVGRERQKME